MGLGSGSPARPGSSSCQSGRHDAHQRAQCHVLRSRSNVDADAADGPNGLPTVAARLAWSLRELDRLDGVIADLNTEMATIRASESGRLWRSFAAGEPVFDRLAVDLRTELNRQRTRLADLTDIQNAISARTKRAARRAYSLVLPHSLQVFIPDAMQRPSSQQKAVLARAIQ